MVLFILSAAIPPVKSFQPTCKLFSHPQVRFGDRLLIREFAAGNGFTILITDSNGVVIHGQENPSPA
jgi:hypothetical protein